MRDECLAQRRSVAHLDDADERGVDILEHGLAVVDDLGIGRRPVTARCLAERVGFTQRAFDRDDRNLATQGAVDFVSRDGAAVESDDGGGETDHLVALHHRQIEFDIAVPVQNLGRVLLIDHSRVLAEVDAIAVGRDDETAGLAVEGHLGGARSRAHGDARVGIGEDCSEVGHHVVLDDALRVELGSAAGEGGPGELAHRLRRLEEDAGGLDAPERVDEEGRHGGNHLRVHALATAHETNDLASRFDAGAPIDSGEVDERCRKRLSLRNDVKGARMRNAVTLVDGDAGNQVLSGGHVWYSFCSVLVSIQLV